MGYRVLALNGSPRENGNTQRALDIVCGRLRQRDIDVSQVRLDGVMSRGCRACCQCQKNKDRRCAIEDELNVILQQVWEADALIIGSPTYFSGVTAETKAFIDRCGYVSRANGGLLRGKIGAAVAVHRRAGANITYAQINYLFGVSEMPIATSSYWNLGVARQPGALDQDEEGVNTFVTLGDNLAEMIVKLRSGV